MGSVRSIMIVVGGLIVGCNAGPSDTPPPPAPGLLDADTGASDGGGDVDAMGTDAMPDDARGFWPDLTCLSYKMACGRCGEQEIMCVDGKHVPGACGGEHGDCTPPDSRETADKCMVRTCTASCAWGPWGLKPGSQCGAGQTQTCVTNPATCGKPTGVRECVSCKWTGCLCK